MAAGVSCLCQALWALGVLPPGLRHVRSITAVGVAFRHLHRGARRLVCALLLLGTAAPANLLLRVL